ncbi:MAG: zinc-binding dehydrogenase [Gemmatimonadetes bacterium]|jgi:2-desacetyl-2-hydroxyethyl bacteriochlorophyllide A dehydrogenase|nr:zinc-binding dehydrogenase [Gemmatimonadota bacterium]
MKGVMFTAKGITELIDEPKPECGEDEVLLKTLFSGLSNGTERSFLTGGAYGGQKWPNRIGYLNVSEVVEKGDGVTVFDLGDVVYTGTSPGHVEYHAAKESDLIVRVPPELDLPAATMLGIAGVSHFNAARVGVEEGDEVLVTGSGGIGLMAMQAAGNMGARVTLAARTEHRRELGVEMGADAVFDPEGEADALRENGPYSVLLECAGIPLDSVMEPENRLLDRFARVALVAGRFRVDYHFLWASVLRLSFFQSTHFDQPTLEQVTVWAAKGKLDLPVLIKDVVPIEDAVEVYDRLRDDPMLLGGTVFDWS